MWHEQEHKNADRGVLGVSMHDCKLVQKLALYHIPQSPMEYFGTGMTIYLLSITQGQSLVRTSVEGIRSEAK